MVPVKLGYVFCSLLPWIFLCAFSHFFSNVLNLLQRLPLNQKLHWKGPQGRGGSFLGLHLPKIAVFSGCWDGDRKMLNEKLTVSLKCQRAAVWCAKQLKKKVVHFLLCSGFSLTQECMSAPFTWFSPGIILLMTDSSFIKLQCCLLSVVIGTFWWFEPHA